MKRFSTGIHKFAQVVIVGVMRVKRIVIDVATSWLDGGDERLIEPATICYRIAYWHLAETVEVVKGRLKTSHCAHRVDPCGSVCDDREGNRALYVAYLFALRCQRYASEYRVRDGFGVISP